MCNELEVKMHQESTYTANTFTVTVSKERYSLDIIRTHHMYDDISASETYSCCSICFAKNVFLSDKIDHRRIKNLQKILEETQVEFCKGRLIQDGITTIDMVFKKPIKDEELYKYAKEIVVEIFKKKILE